MSDGDDVPVAMGGQGVYSRIELRLDRIEDKLDTRLNALDSKVDGVVSRMDRQEGKLEGSIGMIRWLGPAGVGALIYGVLKASGYL